MYKQNIILYTNIYGWIDSFKDGSVIMFNEPQINDISILNCINS
jgi:hypothetical protein